MIVRGTLNFVRVCLVLLVVPGIVLGWGCARPAPTTEVEKTRPISDEQYKKEMEEIKKNIRSETKIKLKKDGKGAYSWEISGKDPYEVIKANSVLSKKINND